MLCRYCRDLAQLLQSSGTARLNIGRAVGATLYSFKVITSGSYIPYTTAAQIKMPLAGQHSELPKYELLYHPKIPGRGEFIRLALEAAAVPYTDIANEEDDGYSQVQRIVMNQGLESADDNPPLFAPPALKIPGAAANGKALILSQTANILIYLGDKIGLVPDDEPQKHYVYQLALTALDLNNEMHDTHHPIENTLYYEDQKEESVQKAQSVRKNRLPKYFSYFERVLKQNERNGHGKYMVGSELTFADTTIWQVLDGIYYAFPKEMAVRKKEHPQLLEDFYQSIKEVPNLRTYLSSKRRQQYSMGIFRYYPELDRQDD